MQQILAVGFGGFIGAVSRFALTGFLQKRFLAFTPAGTLFVNVLGCLLIGGLMAVVVNRPNDFNPTLRLFLITGILGSMTTFSTFGYETVELLREERFRPALLNVVANLAVGLPAVVVGWTLAKAFIGESPPAV